MRKIALVLAVWLAAVDTGFAASTSVTLSAAGASTPVVIDTDHFYPGVGIVCTKTGTLTYSVQVSGDGGPISGITNWNEHDVITAQTVSINDSIAFPVTYVRVNVTSYASGSVTCSFVQAGNVQQFQWYQKGADRP